MEEQTLHILNECSSGCKMAIHSMQQVLEYVENEKLEQVIMAAERKHKEIAARTAKALTSEGLAINYMKRGWEQGLSKGMKEGIE